MPYHEVSYSMNGNPADVLTYQRNDDLPAPTIKGWSTLYRVDLMNAPWNPANALAVLGFYASPYPDEDPKRDALAQSPFHSGYTVAGSDTFGRVAEIAHNGSDTSDADKQGLQVGDWVIVAQPGLGTMRSTMWVPGHALLRLDRGQELWEKIGPKASSLFQLGGTAIRLLRDFVKLQPGEIVLQNAGNSAVGFMVSQLAKLHLGVLVVSLVRKSSKTPAQMTELITHLTENGKNILVVAEEDLQDKERLEAFQAQLKKLGNGKLPRLALDSVGGPSASLLLSCLANRGTMVTYGGSSRQPVALNSSHLIFKDLKACGFWYGRWMVEHSFEEKYEMVNELVESVLSEGIDCPPVEVFPLSQLKQAMEWESNQQSSLAIRPKLVWDCQN